MIPTKFHHKKGLRDRNCLFLLFVYYTPQWVPQRNSLHNANNKQVKNLDDPRITYAVKSQPTSCSLFTSASARSVQQHIRFKMCKSNVNFI